MHLNSLSEGSPIFIYIFIFVCLCLLSDVSRARDRDLELRAALTQILFVNRNYILDSTGT